MPSSSFTMHDKEKRAIRRRNHIAKDLMSPKYKPKRIERQRREEEDERNYRRYGLATHGYDPLDD